MQIGSGDKNQIFPNIETPIVTPATKGADEAVRILVTKSEIDKKAIENMVQNSNKILMRISSIFPFDFFPSHMTVESTRITVIHRQLFSSQVHSVDIKDISNIFINTTIFFAQLEVVSSTFEDNEIHLNKLWKKDAILMRRIVEGLRQFVKQNIDMSVFSTEELLSKLKELSTTEIVL